MLRVDGATDAGDSFEGSRRAGRCGEPVFESAAGRWERLPDESARARRGRSQSAGYGSRGRDRARYARRTARAGARSWSGGHGSSIPLTIPPTAVTRAPAKRECEDRRQHVLPRWPAPPRQASWIAAGGFGIGRTPYSFIAQTVGTDLSASAKAMADPP